MPERPAPAGITATADSWAGVPARTLRSRWSVAELLVLDRVGSTNDLISRLARQGYPAGTCVVAESQTDGRGRAGRRWESAPGLGVWLSVLLRPARLAAPGSLPLRVGAALAEALEPFCAPARPAVKWPNDLTVDGRKLGGILCEATWDGDRCSHVVVGVGINALHRASDLPAELAGSATSVRLVSDRDPDRAELGGAIVRAVLAVAERPDLHADALAALRARDALRDTTVRWTTDRGATIIGTGAGIDPDGALLLRSADGVLHRVRTGTVRPSAPARQRQPSAR
jgi:BirA family transcriptional regulator, biotin operon repressor / biotin---[acetyl-CoA-carboxylase] ligase